MNNGLTVVCYLDINQRHYISTIDSFSDTKILEDDI